MRTRTLLTLHLSVLLLAAVAAAKKPSGTISDPVAFSQIHSYCVDSDNMAGDEALDVKDFMIAESKSKKLLAKLPWTLASDCTQNSPDAVVRLEFSTYYPVTEAQTGAAAPGNGPAQEEFYKIRVTLRVFQGGSSQALYEVEADPLNNSLTGAEVVPADVPLPVQRRNAIYGAFWKLADDVRQVSQTKSK